MSYYFSYTSVLIKLFTFLFIIPCLTCLVFFYIFNVSFCLFYPCLIFLQKNTQVFPPFFLSFSFSFTVCPSVCLTFFFAVRLSSWLSFSFVFFLSFSFAFFLSSFLSAIFLFFPLSIVYLSFFLLLTSFHSLLILTLFFIHSFTHYEKLFLYFSFSFD